MYSGLCWQAQPHFFVLFLSMQPIIRIAEKSDCSGIYSLIKELAVFVKAESSLVLTPEQLEVDGFGPTPLFKAFVAELDNEIVGVAVIYPKYSTWKGKAIYLEDLVVKQNQRGKNIGTLLFNQVLNYAKEYGAQRLDWQAYDWNEVAVNFYKRYNANIEHDWININLLPSQF